MWFDILSLTSIVIVGILIGMVSNRLKYFGNTALNILVLGAIIPYQEVARNTELPTLPDWAYFFLLAYGIGTFLHKALIMVHIPVLSHIARFIGGNY